MLRHKLQHLIKDIENDILQKPISQFLWILFVIVLGSRVHGRITQAKQLHTDQHSSSLIA